VKDPTPLKAASNGSRLLIVHSPKDLSRHWHAREERSQPDAFAIGLNLLVYASGKSGYRNRLETPYIQPPTQEPTSVLDVARLQYDGDWDPEPAAWPRFSHWLRRWTGADVNAKVVTLAELASYAAPLAHLTGTRSFIATESDAAGLKRFVDAGGVVMIDAAGGQAAFADSAERLLSLAFPQTKLAPIPKGHPMLSSSAPGMNDLSTPRWRPFVVETRGGKPLQMVSSGLGHVVFSRMDVSTGLLGTRTWGVAGFDPDYAATLVKNVLFWAVDEQGRDATTQPTTLPSAK
jgi:hypothetical protein